MLVFKQLFTFLKAWCSIQPFAAYIDLFNVTFVAWWWIFVSSSAWLVPFLSTPVFCPMVKIGWYNSQFVCTLNYPVRQTWLPLFNRGGPLIRALIQGNLGCIPGIGTRCFKKCKQYLEYQYFLLLRNIWWSKI